MRDIPKKKKAQRPVMLLQQNELAQGGGGQPETARGGVEAEERRTSLVPRGGDNKVQIYIYIYNSAGRPVMLLQQNELAQGGQRSGSGRTEYELVPRGGTTKSKTTVQAGQ